MYKFSEKAYGFHVSFGACPFVSEFILSDQGLFVILLKVDICSERYPRVDGESHA